MVQPGRRFCRPTRAAFLAAALAAAATPAAQDAGGTVPAAGVPEGPGARRYDRLRSSLFTVEVHSGNREAKTALGSGYLVSADGRVATNYHVVGRYVEEPERYSIRVRSGPVTLPARLLGFDLVNDLAILEVAGAAGPPLPLSTRPPGEGASIVAFGNPEGLGLSLVTGVFNGLAEHGIVDRMLLSMPLNSGMSGGPILDDRDEVVGTNVSTMWGSDSLSFGVPVAKLQELLARPPLETSREAFLEETRRQLRGFEATAAARLLAAFESSSGEAKVVVGGARAIRPADRLQCWDGSQEYPKEGVTDSWYQCSLDFAPTVENLGWIGYTWMSVHHRRAGARARGLYASIEYLARSWTRMPAVAPGDPHRLPPRCVSGRFVVSTSVWKANTCFTPYAKHPGFGDYEIIGISVSEPLEATLVYLRASGFRPASFDALARVVLEGIEPRGTR